MKTLVLMSLMVALLFGLCIGFLEHVQSFRGGVKFDPPIPADEWRRLQQLPIAQIEQELSTRRRPVTRMQYVMDSVGHSYFWKGVASCSIVPVIGVFVACVLVGSQQKRSENLQTDRG